jgi:hypothetical protein
MDLWQVGGAGQGVGLRRGAHFLERLVRRDKIAKEPRFGSGRRWDMWGKGKLREAPRRIRCLFCKELGSPTGKAWREAKVPPETGYSHLLPSVLLSTCTGPCCSSSHTTLSMAATCGLGISWLLEPSVDR